MQQETVGTATFTLDTHGTRTIVEGAIANGEIVSARLVQGDVWCRRIAAEPVVWRRGKLTITDEVNFIDEPQAKDTELQATDTSVPPKDRLSLDVDMADSPHFRERLRNDDLFACLTYAALCNREWRRGDTTWSCTWRSAGAIVSGIRGHGDYMDFYCWGNEGMLDEDVSSEIAALGWSPLSSSDDDY